MIGRKRDTIDICQKSELSKEQTDAEINRKRDGKWKEKKKG